MLTAGTMWAQAFQDRFDAALNSGNMKEQRQVLSEWMANAPEDVDCYIARYNYYVNYVGDAVSQGSKGMELELRMAADSGLAVIDEAIAHYPERLDLRFGKIYFLGVLRSWDAFVDEIVACLDYSEQIAHRWTFPNVEDAIEDLMMESMMDYQISMFENTSMYEKTGGEQQPTASDTAMMMRMRRVAKRSVQLFPRDLEQVRILAETYSFVGDYASAVRYLQRAERIDPNNVTVLRQLREAYKRMGKKDMAKQYNERLMQLMQ